MIDSETIKEVRKELGMTLMAISEQTSYSSNMIHLIEKNQRKIPKKLVTEIKNITKKKIEKLKKLVDTL